jgi:hypothetical protein
MHPLFTELIRPAASTAASAAASAAMTFHTASDPVDDICLAEVEEYLQFLVHLQGLSDSDFHKFMQYSSGFFFSNSKLWCCDTHKRHKIVVLKERRCELLKEVHNILGHKKIYAVWMQLLEIFL